MECDAAFQHPDKAADSKDPLVEGMSAGVGDLIDPTSRAPRLGGLPHGGHETAGVQLAELSIQIAGADVPQGHHVLDPFVKLVAVAALLGQQQEDASHHEILVVLGCIGGSPRLRLGHVRPSLVLRVNLGDGPGGQVKSFRHGQECRRRTIRRPQRPATSAAR